ncbi:hypothetical protein [Microvirga pudoricolor]|uniref:hypothetical protein n=1 Tax=Microvirga pudoricolor TaxID=2778729 RepID=UPI0019509128|nr:hypothetical protein [Microvirga pudoricolor]MBM6594657.1 hypothetical protein [Microvirga pudoricolor]
MAFKRTTIALTAMMITALGSTQAFAVRANERPPPNGMNGPSINGFDEQFPVGAKRSGDGFPASEAHFPAPASVAFPDGSRLTVK